MIGSYWNDLSNTQIPWVGSFSRIVKSVSPPVIHGDSIFISSDYSGDHPKSKYSVLSILAIDLSKVIDWEIKRRDIRGSLLLNNRRMSFKGLNDIYKRNAMPRFIESANALNGLLVNVVLSKGINDIIYSETLHKVLSDLNLTNHKWNATAFKRVSTIVHFIALVIAGLIRDKQNVYWYSDEDNMFANETISKDVSMILGRFSGMYVTATPGELGIGTTKLNEDDFFEEDLNAIPDLAAGALSEFFNKVHSLTDRNNMRNFAYLFPKDLTSKAEHLINWNSNPSRSLKKVTVVFDRGRKKGSYKIWRFDTAVDPRLS